MADLSVIVPARNEIFVKNTIDDILKNIRGDTEVIVVLDGYWPDPPIYDNPRVVIIHHSVSIGQRAACNEAVRLSSAKYIMKVDAHCAFDEGFDSILIDDIEDNSTIVPIMRNLYVFDWVCKQCGQRTYQGPTPTKCSNCGNTVCFEKDIVWIAKKSPQSSSYCFDPQPHFQYFNDFRKRPEGKGDLTESMSLQGSCFMMSRDMYLDLNICDEAFGSWGSQGIEVACKTWLSGGRVLVDHRTWYAHLFRTQGKDFSFPYPMSGSQQKKAMQYAKELFFNNRWHKQVRPLSWLVEKFWPVYKWTEEDLENLKQNEQRNPLLHV